MILFDLIVLPNIVNVLPGLSLNFRHETAYFNTSNLAKKNLGTAYIVKSVEILREPKNDIAKKRFIAQSFWQKIVDNIWRQTVFLSIPTKASNKYTVELNYLNMHRNRSTSKDLLSSFSKSLLEGSIDSSIYSNMHSYPIFSGIQYAWPKYFQMKLKKTLTLFQPNIYSNYFYRVKSYLNQKSSMNRLPLFAVSNNLGQMIISEPSSELGIKKDLLDYMLPHPHNKGFNQAWFFTNFKDAQEYMESINQYYGLKKNHLKIFISDFSTFYNIAAKFSSKVSCRIVPDLEEISNLIKSYRYYGNISFHKRQKYSSSFFQGQPLYILKTNNNSMYAYLHKGQKIDQRNLVFTDYQTAYSVLNKIADDNLNSKKFKAPDLIVYNLESFIKDQLSAEKHFMSSFILVPSQASYWFAKKQLLKTKTTVVYELVAKHMSFMQLWSKRVLWSLTSKSPQGC